ncbi:MAG: sulfite exporter TauE/SafE family protein [Deltaproteobacteria bacterium]|nr:sulfite exporter TauE/SafE family protein [Deltaproteobacteria bacterium]
MIARLAIYFLIGLFAGAMSGMFGIGGGSVRTPLLYLAGLPLLSAFGINLIVIPFSSLVGALSHRRNIDWKYAKYVVPGGTVGTVTGAFLAGWITTPVLAVVFVVVSVITVLGIHFERISPRRAERINPTGTAVVSGAFFLNLITAMRGGSGGSLFPPFLKMMKLDIRKAIATSLFATIFTAMAGGAVFWYRGDVPPLAAVVVIIGSMGGARLGSSISLRTKPLWFETGLSVFIVLLAMVVVYKAL